MLWFVFEFSRVIVPLQLGYLHNQLSGLAILFPYLLQFFSLHLALCLTTCSCTTTVCMLVFVLLCYMTGFDYEQIELTFHIYNSLQLKATGHCSLFTLLS